MPLSNTNFQTGRSRFDFVDFLAVSDESLGGDTLVISAELKNVKGVIEAELLITGYVSDPSGEELLARYLVPLLTIQVPLGNVSDGATPNYRSGAMVEEVAIRNLRKLFPALIELARTAQKSSGLVDAAITLKMPEGTGKKVKNVREVRQNRKLDLALAHLELHWSKRPESQMEYVDLGKYKAPKSIVYFANLYSLARGMGVKEVRPRIQNEPFFETALADYRTEGIYVKQAANSNQTKKQKSNSGPANDAYDFAEMVAKLKRANFLLQRP